jgi:hypothetical protein
MVCMIFIVHTIAAAQPMLKMCCPDAYIQAVDFDTRPAAGVQKIA